MIGIYKILNRLNGDFYIGSSKDIYKRWVQHQRELKKGTHYNLYLQRAYNKYGRVNFIYQIVEICEEDSLLEKEQNYLDTINPSYNLNPKANQPPNQKGKKQTKEHIEKRASQRRGQTFNAEIRKNMSKPRKPGHNITSSHNYKAVLQIELGTNRVLNKFTSVMNAGIFINSQNGRKAASGISKCLQGKNSTAYNYYWIES